MTIRVTIELEGRTADDVLGQLAGLSKLAHPATHSGPAKAEQPDNPAPPPLPRTADAWSTAFNMTKKAARLAIEKGLEPKDITATGKDGRITLNDVRAAVPGGVPDPVPEAVRTAGPRTAPDDPSSVDRAQVKAGLVEIQRERGDPAVANLLHDVGAARFSEVPVERMPELAKAVQVILNEMADAADSDEEAPEAAEADVSASGPEQGAADTDEGPDEAESGDDDDEDGPTMEDARDALHRLSETAGLEPCLELLKKHGAKDVTKLSTAKARAAFISDCNDAAEEAADDNS